jgi:hypothetical protein
MKESGNQRPSCSGQNIETRLCSKKAAFNVVADFVVKDYLRTAYLQVLYRSMAACNWLAVLTEAPFSETGVMVHLQDRT